MDKTAVVPGLNAVPGANLASGASGAAGLSAGAGAAGLVDGHYGPVYSGAYGPVAHPYDAPK